MHELSKFNIFIPLRPVAPTEGGRRGQALKVERDLNNVGNII